MVKRLAEWAALAWVLPWAHGAGTLTLSADGLTIYDSANNITWLADGNLAASNRFGLPVCAGSNSQPCVNASGSMNYPSAAAWVAAMNAASYLGNSDWQVPTTPITDRGCTKVGPNGGSFGYGCTASAFGSLYYNGLRINAPNTAVPIPSNSLGPFNNVQPYLYWSQTSMGSSGNGAFSFDTGWQGANTLTHVMYLWPMIPGKLAGTPAAGNGLEVNPGGATVYDPQSNVTWVANANLAASNSMGLPPCQSATSPSICVNLDGGLNLDSANQFIANMNSTGYLGQKNWQTPAVDANCSGFNCGGNASPMGELFYKQFGLSAGAAAVATPNIAVGPFHNIQPYLYWTCQGAAIQNACEAAGPVANQEWSFSFGNGFEGTDILPNELFVTAYFVGSRPATPVPTISLVANAEGENPVIAPNTWVEIKGANLSKTQRMWGQPGDFGPNNNTLPAALDGVSATVNGKAAYVYYISAGQVNILTPPDTLPSGQVNVVLTNNGESSSTFSVQAQALSPSLFVFDGTHIVAQHFPSYTDVGPATLFPGLTTPAQPGETILVYANGFGPTSTPVVSGSVLQSGSLATLPDVKIGGVDAAVGSASLIGPGLFQFNVTIPLNAPNGDLPIVATYNGLTTQSNAVVTVQQ
ncbi:MAG TPA: hypothetical protein VKS01_05210 [Bryobacteraceae bacterium]|nr:hypothetical protein [Bryobacteraceae bacterium]